MEQNNFEKLQDEMELKFANTSDAIKKNVSSRKGMWDLIGDLFELYIPKIISTLIGSNGPLRSTGIQQENNKDAE